MPAVALIAATFLSIPTMPSALPTDVWAYDWQARIQHAGITPALVEEWGRIDALTSRTEPEPSPQMQPVKADRSVASGMGDGNVEQWRSLVEQHFQPEDVDIALRIIGCESGGNPNAKNPTSTASGLFQHLRGWWSGQWGLPPFDPFNPEQSIAAGAALRYRNGGWSDWNPSAYCWRR